MKYKVLLVLIGYVGFTQSMSIDYDHELTRAEACAVIRPRDQFSGGLSDEHRNGEWFHVARRPSMQPLYVIEKEGTTHYSGFVHLSDDHFAMEVPAYGSRDLGLRCIFAGYEIGGGWFHRKPNGGKTTLLAATNRKIAQVTGNIVAVDKIEPQGDVQHVPNRGHHVTAIGFNKDSSLLAVGDSHGIAAYSIVGGQKLTVAALGYYQNMKNVKQLVDCPSGILAMNGRKIALVTGTYVAQAQPNAHLAGVTYKRLFRMNEDSDRFILQATVDGTDKFFPVLIDTHGLNEALAKDRPGEEGT